MTKPDHVVYDACVVSKARGSIAARKPSNALDRRLRALERVVIGSDVPRYNSKLLREYEDHLQDARNDVVEAFMTLLFERGVATKSSLSRQDHAKASAARWPDHDQHVLAAAVGARKCDIYTTESALCGCADEIRRVFGWKILGV